MRIFALTGMLLLAGLLSPARALAADTWCLRNFDDPPGKPCVAAPLDYCLRGLIAGGGVCGRDRGGNRDVTEGRARSQRDDRRDDRKDRWN